MTIMVDELRVWPAPSEGDKRHCDHLLAPILPVLARFADTSAGAVARMMEDSDRTGDRIWENRKNMGVGGPVSAPPPRPPGSL